jgi:hypothetical protein
MNPAIRAAYDRVYEAEAKRDALIKETYQVGDIVYYEHADHRISAEVLHCSGERLKVRGRSGKEYWVGAYRLTS